MALHKGLVRMSSDDYVAGIPYVNKGTNLCRLPGLTCMGCCGLDFAKKLGPSAKPEFIKGMRQSFIELEQVNNDKKKFKELYDPEDLHDCGMCRRLVCKTPGTLEQLKGKKNLDITCPLHPAENDGVELRKGECDFKFMCAGQRQFHTWDDRKRQAFVAYIVSLDLDWFTYSVRMHDDTILHDFLKVFEK